MRHAFLGLPRVRVALAWTDLGARVARHLDRGIRGLPTRPRPNIGWPARLVADPGSSGVESVAARDELVVPSLDRPVGDEQIHSASYVYLAWRRIRGCSCHRRSALAPHKHTLTRVPQRSALHVGTDRSVVRRLPRYAISAQRATQIDTPRVTSIAPQLASASEVSSAFIAATAREPSAGSARGYRGDRARSGAGSARVLCAVTGRRVR